MKRALRLVAIAGALGGALLVLAVGITAYVLDLDHLLNSQLSEHLPQLEQRLGRKVEVGAITTTFLPVMGGQVQGLRLGGDPRHPEDPLPLLEIRSVRFEIAWGEALASLGRRVHVTSLVIEGLSLNAVRYADGSLSYQDLLDHPPPAAPVAPGPPEPLDPRLQQLLRDLVIDSIRVAGASAHLEDHATPSGKVASESIHDIQVSAAGVRLAEPIRITAEACAFSERPNLRLQGSVGPLPADLVLSGMPRLSSLELEVDHLDLAKLAPYLGRALPVRLESAVLSSKLQVAEVAPARPLPIDGFVEVKDLQVQGGARFDARVDARLALDLEKLGAEIAQLQLKVGAVQLAASGSLRNLAASPQFEAFTIESTTLDPGALLSYFPGLGAGLPPGFQVSGQASLDLRADGDAHRQLLKASLDADPLDLLWPGRLVKPKGMPLAVRVDGEYGPTEAYLQALELIVDQLDLVVHGTAKNLPRPTLDFVAGSRPVPFDRLVRLLPQAAGWLKEGTPAEGLATIDAHLRGSEQSLDAALEVGLRGVKLEAQGTHLEGEVTLKALAEGDVSRNLHTELHLEGSQAVIQIEGRINKDAKAPLRLDWVADRAGEQVLLKALGLRLANLQLEAQGSFDLQHGTTDLAVSFPPLDVERLAKTVTAIPADLARGGQIEARVGVEGNPNRLETMAVAVESLQARLGRSDLQGSIRVANWERPSVEVQLSSTLLDLDQLAPLGPALPRPTEREGAPAADEPGLRDRTLRGAFYLKRLRVHGRELQNVKCQARMEKGVLLVDDCAFQTAGGQVSAKGSRIDLWRGVPPFEAQLTIQGMELGPVLALLPPLANTWSGTLDANLDLKGAGIGALELQRSLQGPLHLSLTHGRFLGPSVTDAVQAAMKDVLGRVPGLAVGSLPDGNAFGDLRADLDVGGGRMTLTRPVLTEVDGNPLTLEGTLGLDGALSLSGTYTLLPAALSQLTRGVCKTTSPMVAPLRVGGTMLKPSFSADSATAGGRLISECVAGGALGGMPNFSTGSLGGLDAVLKGTRGMSKSAPPP